MIPLFFRALSLQLLVVLSARAAPVAVPDASFDARGLNAGSWNSNLTPWQESGGTGSGNGFIERINGFAADGLNHLGMHLGHDVWQNLATTYQPHTRYTLTVAVGNRSIHTAGGNQSQYLLAATDGSIFATGSFGAASLPVQTFADAPALVFDTSSNPAAVGKPIRILLRARGQGRSHFDQIRLIAVPAQPQTIDFPELDPASVGDPAFALTATASSGLQITYTSSDSGVASVSGDTLTIVSAGSTTITAKQVGDANYQPAPEVARTLTVYGPNRDSQTIDFPAVAAVSSTSPPFSLDATASSGLPVRYASSNPAVATVSGELVTIHGKGTATITASQAGNADYLRAPSVERVLTVNATPQTISFGELPPQTLGNHPFSLSATASSGLPVQFESSDPSVASVVAGVVTLNEAGSAVITASQGGDALFDPAPAVSRTLAVHPAASSLTVDPDALTIRVRAGESLGVPIEIGNPSAGAVDWRVSILDAAGKPTALASALNRIQASGDTLYGALPDLLQFTGGESGTEILNGNPEGYQGISLFNSGNKLSTNLGGLIPYSNNAIAFHEALGANGSYFTRKFPGMFLFGADLDGVSWFQLDGSIVGGSNTENSTFQIDRNGVSWSALVQKSLGLSRGFNQLILVDDPAARHAVVASSNYQQLQRVQVRPGTRRLYYLLFINNTGGSLPEQVFADLANRVLDTVSGAPSFILKVDPAAGGTSGNGLSGAMVTARAADLLPGTHQAALAFNPPTGSTRLATVPVTVEVTEPRIDVPNDPVNHLAIERGPQATVEVPVTAPSGAVEPWSADIVETPGWLSLADPDGVTPDPVRLVFDPAGLAVGRYSATLRLTSGPATFLVPVLMTVDRVEPKLTRADMLRPRLYVLNEGIYTSSVLVLSEAAEITHVIPVGKWPRDCAFSPDGRFLYTANFFDSSVTEIDLETLEATRTHPVAVERSLSQFNIAAGHDGVIYHTNAANLSTVSAVDMNSGAVLSTYTPSGEGAGPLWYDAVDRMLYYGRAGSNSTYLSITRLSTDGGSLNFHSRTNTGGISSPISGLNGFHASLNRDRVAVGAAFFDLQDLSQIGQSHFNSIRAMSAYGHLFIGTSTSVIDSETRQSIGSFDGLFPAFTRSQDAVVFYHSITGKFSRWPIPAAALPPALELNPSPANNGVFPSGSATVKWNGLPHVEAYRLYAGTDRAAVENAAPGSAEDLGLTTATSYTFDPVPEPGTEIFWRVEPIRNGVALESPTQSVVNSSVQVTPEVTTLRLPAGILPQTVSIDVLDGSGAPVAWSVSESISWFTPDAPAGPAGTPVTGTVAVGGLALGAHDGSIDISVGGRSHFAKLSITLYQPDLASLRSDPSLPSLVYGLHRGGQNIAQSQILAIRAATAEIERVVDVGLYADDFTVDPAANRLYATNSTLPHIVAVDLNSFSRLPSIPAPVGTFSVSAAGQGRLMVVRTGSGRDSDLATVDAFTGETRGSITLTNPFASYYSGESNAAGTRYYLARGEGGVAVVDISGNDPVILATEYTGSSGRPFVSRDGSRVFQRLSSYTSDMKEVRHLGDFPRATDSRAAVVVMRNSILWTDTGELIASLSPEATLAAVSANDSHVVLWNSAAKKLTVLPLASLVSLPGPRPQPGEVIPMDQALELSWTAVPNASIYRIFLGTTKTEVEAASSGAPLQVATSSALRLELPPPAFGKRWFWRVDAVTPDGIFKGNVWWFDVPMPELAPPAKTNISSSWLDRLHVSKNGAAVGVPADGAIALFKFGAADGRPVLWQNLEINGDAYSSYPAPAIGDRWMVAGDPHDNKAGPLAGALFVHPQRDGMWAVPERITPLSAPANSYFGSALVADGGFFLAGLSGYVGGNTRGRVAAYREWPQFEAHQEFQPGDGVVGDQFGAAIAIQGNRAVIGAPATGIARQGRGYIFEFVPTSATWVQRASLIPASTDQPVQGGSVALDDDTAVLGSSDGSSSDSVTVFTRSSTGAWTQSAVIENPASFISHRNRFGASLAIAGDVLFVGASGDSSGGTNGKVFVFHREGTSWSIGATIENPRKTLNFGAGLAVRDGVLYVSSTEYLHSYRIAGSANRTPRFLTDPPTQFVVGLPVDMDVLAGDADGLAGLTIQSEHLPSGLSLEDLGNGRARLSGTPAAAPGGTSFLRWRVTDSDGASDRQAARVTVFASAALPTFAREPSEANLGVGQELVLRAAAAGTGPFQWQWYRDGKAIEGATSDRYFVAEVGLADSGRYTVRVSNSVGEIESSAIEVAVRPADRFAGGWPTFGGSAAHTGRHPATLDSFIFLPVWNADVEAGHVLHRAAIADGRAFVVPQSGFDFVPAGVSARALDLKTGSDVWQFPLTPSTTTNPPSVHDGKVYFQRGKGVSDPTAPQLFSLDAESGARLWASPFGAQWETYEAPAVTDLGIFINGGTYGGMYGFNFDGSQNFYVRLPQYDRWTPTIWNGRVFSWVAGRFTEHSHVDGSARWSVDVGWASSGWMVNTVAAVSDNCAVVMKPTELACIDLPTRSVRWRVAGTFRGSPGIAGGRAFAILGNRVMSYSLADGAPDLIYQTDAPTTYSYELIDQPILFNDRLVISNSTKTWIFNLESAELLQTLNAGGRLSYSDGYLLAAGDDGVLRAFEATPLAGIAIDGPDEKPLRSGVSAVRVGAAPVGESSFTPLTLHNAGQADLEIWWEITGDQAADFAVSNEPDKIVEGSGKTAIDISFTPSAKGRRTAILTIFSNDPAVPEFNITLYADPPEVDALAASDISGVSAVLNGAIRANSDDLTVSFQYGLTPEYGAEVAGVPLALAGDDDELVSAAIDGLTPGTTYHYRAGATTAHGTHWSENLSFTTLSDNALLAGLSLSSETLVPGFDSTRTHYITTVPFTTSVVSIAPVTDHPGATVSINGNPVAGGGSLPIELEVGNNTLASVVTAEDGITARTYEIIVTRLPMALAFRSATDVPVSVTGFAAAGLTVNLEIHYAPDAGTSLTVVNNTGLDFISGNFVNLVHGQRITLDHDGVSYDFVANYFGGTGNDLVLHWADTELVAWGANASGQIGDATTERRLVPTAVSDDGPLAGKTLLGVSVGYLHSLALDSDGSLAAWGSNTYGQLGNNSGAGSPAPVAVDASGVLAGRTVIAISAGPFHNLALCSDGSIVAWGYNNEGQLGTGDKQASRVPVLVKPVGALAGKRVIAVAAGSYHSFALCSDGSVAAWGYNDEGELGDGTTESSSVPVAVDSSGALSGRQVASISAGQYHALALCTDGSLVTWGYNRHGQLGTGDITDRASPVEIGSLGALAGKTVVATAAGGSHSLAHCSDGTLFAWGHNNRSQLGTGGISHSSVPLAVTMPQPVSGRTIAGIAAGWQHNLVRFSDGSTSAWGGNANGELGGIATATSADPGLVDIGGLPAGARFISADSGSASSHNLAIMAYRGGQMSAIESWRLEIFGSTANEGEGADDHAFSNDGIPNLIKYAFGLDPRENSSGRLPQARMENGALVLRYTRPPGSLGVVCSAEWSDTLEPASWKPVPDTGSADEHLFSLPTSGGGTRFMRLKVTGP